MSGHAWYLDSLDGRAGIGFGSFRGAWSTAFASLDEGMAVRVAAPDFQAEILASNGTGLAATRGTFQMGLYLTPKEEVAFPTVAAMIEFIRRLYLRSGSADPGGQTTPPDTNMPNGDVDLDNLPADKEADPVTQLTIAFNAFKRAGVGMGSTKTASPCDVWQLAGISGARLSRRLARAAVRLLWHVCHRAPHGQKADQWLSWSIECTPLVRALDRLQLWPLLAMEFDHQIDFLSARFAQVRPHLPGHSARLPALRHLMVTGWVPHHHYPFDVVGAIPPSEARWSPFDDLGKIGIPAAATDGICPDDMVSRATLRNLLVGLLGQPLSAGAGTDLGDVRMELLIFATSYLAAAQMPSSTPSYLAEIIFGGGPMSTMPIVEAFAERVVERALRWLEQELPRWVYKPEVEEMITAADERIRPFA